MKFIFQSSEKALKASESCNELLKMDGRELEDKIVEHIKQMAKAGASTSSIRLTLSAVQRFFVENRQENRVNWSWLKSRIPRSNGKVKDRDYTKEELVKMWEQSDIRKKAILRCSIGHMLVIWKFLHTIEQFCDLTSRHHTNRNL